jgi:CDP-paratose 2-epimerase
VQAIINRCGVIAGPWQMGRVDQGFFVLWLACHLYGGELSYIGYNGSGKQVRDLLYIEDLCELTMLQIARFRPV